MRPAEMEMACGETSSVIATNYSQSMPAIHLLKSQIVQSHCEGCDVLVAWPARLEALAGHLGSLTASCLRCSCNTCE